MKKLSGTRVLLARLQYTLDYEKDPDPDHWRTISGAHVHIENGKIDGGAAGKFSGRVWLGKRQKISQGNQLSDNPEARAQGEKAAKKQSRRGKNGDKSRKRKNKVQ